MAKDKELAKKTLEVSSLVGGRLKLFYHEWQKITQDKFVLDCVKGYKIPFWKKPKQKLFHSKVNRAIDEWQNIEQAIESLEEKGAIKVCKAEKGQFLSPYFLVPKPDGSFRFIFNLKKLNSHVRSVHFKLEDLKTATQLISSGDHMISIDLQDAYLLVPVHKQSQKYLKFEFRGKLYKFVCLPFGLSTSPYVFTKVLKPVMKILRSQAYRSVIYLDDILCIGGHYDDCLKNALATINTLQTLGFLINNNKSVLVPKTVCKFLGFLLDSEQIILKLTEKKKEALISLLKSFLKIESCKIVKFAQLLGKLVATCPAIEYGWLYTKLMESEKLHYLRSSSMNYNAKMEISAKVKSEMEWWITNIPIVYKKFKVNFYEKEIYTDASDSGWGATDGYNSTYGFWNAEEKKWHINYKELFAVKMALEYLAQDLRNCCIYSGSIIRLLSHI